MRYHNAFNRANGRAEPGKVTGERLGFRTSVKKREAGSCVRGFMCLLED